MHYFAMALTLRDFNAVVFGKDKLLGGEARVLEVNDFDEIFT